MNRTKIEKIFKDLKESDYHINYTGGNGYIDLFEGRECTQDGINLEFIEHIYTEGDGAYQAVVYKLADINTGEVRFIKFEGVNNSWYEDYWEDSFVFCEPKEVIVTKYENIEDPE